MTSHSILEKDISPNSNLLSLQDYWQILYAAKYYMVLIIMLVLGAVSIYLYITPAVYSVDAIVQVEERSGMLGGDMEKLASLFGDGTSKINGEIELIRSRTILSRIIEHYQLNIDIKEDGWKPWLRFKKKFSQNNTNVQDLLGMPIDYIPLHVEMQEFEVPKKYNSRYLKVYMDSPISYIMMDNDENILLQGNTEERIEKNGFIIDFSVINAEQGQYFYITKINMFDAIQNLLNSLSIREKSKDSDLIQVSFKSTDPELAGEIVNSLVHDYVMQNIQRHSEEASKSIRFLEHQLPAIQKELKVAESLLNKFRTNNQSLNLQEEGKSLLDQMVAVQQQISQTEVERSAMKLKYTTHHPMIQSIDARLSRLAKEAYTLELRMRKMPKTEQKVLTLMREKRVKNDMYTFLLNKLQELRVVQAGTVGNVRVVDYAMIPSTPISPKKPKIMIAAFVAGFFLGVLYIFVRTVMRTVIVDPEVLERITSKSVVVSIPHSDVQKSRSKSMAEWKKLPPQDKMEERNFLLTMDNSSDASSEALLSLRTSLHFMLPSKEENIIAISGPSASLGKSFISANISALLASYGEQKILLVDADLRRGHLHDYFGIAKRNKGLTEAIDSSLSWQEYVQPTSIENLDILTTGELPANPANTLMKKKFAEILSEASKLYDIVWIDTPPVLVATDATLIGRQADVQLLLLRFAMSTESEVKESIRRLHAAGVAVDGLLLNDVNLDDSRYGYYYGKYYGKYYAYHKER